MEKVLVTGVSSGIGRELVKQLVGRGDSVLGIARRKDLLASLKKDLGNSSKFNYLPINVTDPTHWRRLIIRMKASRFVPRVVIFNAAILEDDYQSNRSIGVETTRKLMETNFFSVLSGLNELIMFIRKGTKIIFIGSVSAFKGSGESGIGYASSKAALNSAFESLYQKFGNAYDFKIVHFGPVATSMVPFNSKIMFLQKPDAAAKEIVKAIDSDNHIFYSPWPLFVLVRLVQLLPSPLYLGLLAYIDSVHRKYRKNDH